MRVSPTSKQHPIKGRTVTTAEMTQTELKEHLDLVQLHPITAADLRLIIENDPQGILKNINTLNGAIIATTASGSSYDIEILDATMDKHYYAGTAKVRQAKYLRTTTSGAHSEKTKFIGISAGDKPRLLFFNDLSDETPDDNSEHSILRVDSSDTITQIQLVVDWSK